MTNPPPRPALERADDAHVSPAQVPPRTPEGPSTTGKGKKKRKREGLDLAVPQRPDQLKMVEMKVAIPKKLRKRLDARAEELGYSRNEAVLLLIEAWLDD